MYFLVFYSIFNHSPSLRSHPRSTDRSYGSFEPLVRQKNLPRTTKVTSSAKEGRMLSQKLENGNKKEIPYVKKILSDTNPSIWARKKTCKNISDSEL